MTDDAYWFCTLLIFASFLLGMKLGLTLYNKADKQDKQNGHK